jgi:oligopeptide transport system substrate-binding protein
MPFIDKVVFSREREGIPYWNKFLQGYYDSSGISSDSFDQAVRLSRRAKPACRRKWRRRASAWRPRSAPPRATSPSTGSTRWSAAASPMRRRASARSCARRSPSRSTGRNSSRSSPTAAAFRRRGRFRPASSASAAGEAGINPVVYDWRERRAAAQVPRRRAAPARRGRLSRRTRREDRPAAGAVPRHHRSRPRRQAAPRLVPQAVRQAADPAGDPRHRLQPLPGKGAQGQRADLRLGLERRLPRSGEFPLPAPRPQSRAKTQGENAANYANPEYDRLFEHEAHGERPGAAGAHRPHGGDPAEDAPWSFGFHPKDYSLHHGWVSNLKPNHMARNGLKYQRSTRRSANAGAPNGTVRCCGRSASAGRAARRQRGAGGGAGGGASGEGARPDAGLHHPPPALRHCRS